MCGACCKLLCVMCLYPGAEQNTERRRQVAGWPVLNFSLLFSLHEKFHPWVYIDIESFRWSKSIIKQNLFDSDRWLLLFFPSIFYHLGPYEKHRALPCQPYSCAPFPQPGKGRLHLSSLQHSRPLAEPCPHPNLPSSGQKPFGAEQASLALKFRVCVVLSVTCSCVCSATNAPFGCREKTSSGD